MSKLRKHDYTLDGSDWDLSALSLNEAPVEQLVKNPKARKIDLSQNFLTQLPPSFTSLTHLIELDLSKNRLTQLPQDFGQLNRLVKLDLYDNKLKTLPITFAQLTKLKWLDLKANPLEPHLAKYAGDCANQRQCQLCAINCLKFMKFERTRIESEVRDKELKLKQKLEFEKRAEEKNKKEKDRKKAKNARRSVRKAQQKSESIDDNNEIDAKDSDSDDTDHSSQSQQKKSSFGKTVFGFLSVLFRISLMIATVLLFLFIGISIGLHLQNGHKLESTEDIKTALTGSLKTIQNYELFIKETSILFQNIIKSLKNWKTSFKIMDEKQNVIKN